MLSFLARTAPLALLAASLVACGQGTPAPEASLPATARPLAFPAQTPGELPGVPAELAVPGGNRLTRRVVGVGVQVYTCAALGGVSTWTFRAPQADLYGAERGVFRKVGTHYAGPTWEDGADGSTVVGRVLRSVPAPPSTPPAIPWLLLEARATTPARSGQPGAFKGTTLVRRLYTLGGTAPTTGCDASRVGAEARVPYAALYEFFAPTP
ncbi:hypothetical protein DAETH_38460 (plasmid) [Deinococcus aetherius]|uniref:DUF3455 domain-containing protein n=1 Tax=Deinococcus aetherius TaxID=200252 RepID=A0ABM8AJ77_9DEIO|nr:DUF3455 domain-containing protein [Deinococcus aetherius]BDP43877.1 hypothetical protein DAETH_38460 [Deinococcus aetherius]